MQLNRILLYRADMSCCATRCRPALTFQDALPRGKANFQYSLTRQHSNVMRASKLVGLAKERGPDFWWKVATSRFLLSTTELLLCIVGKGYKCIHFCFSLIALCVCPVFSVQFPPFLCAEWVLQEVSYSSAIARLWLVKNSIPWQVIGCSHMFSSLNLDSAQ